MTDTIEEVKETEKERLIRQGKEAGFPTRDGKQIVAMMQMSNPFFGSVSILIDEDGKKHYEDA